MAELASRRFGDFQQVNIRFFGSSRRDLFAAKNNKTLAETLEQSRYTGLKFEVERRYGNRLDDPLGEFLFERKTSKDHFYKSFLNSYGDLEYCTFEIADSWALNQRGVYLYSVDSEVKYVGRCKDSMKKRINQGYGKIHPKNCYLDGQATNCRINALICEVKDRVSLWLLPLFDADEIDSYEKSLLNALDLTWNIQHGTRSVLTKKPSITMTSSSNIC